MKFLICSFFASLLLICAGCMSEKLPSEDIEVLTEYRDIIKVLRDPELPTNSKEKYEAAKELVKHVDFYFTRETATIDKLLYHRDAKVDIGHGDNTVYSFTYRYGDKFIALRFFAYKMFIVRVEITENE